MTITTLSAREFSQDASKAKRAAERGPVVITDRGRPSHVLLTYEDYRQLSGPPMSAAEAFAGDGDFDFEPAKLGDDIFRPATFDE